MTDTSEGRGGGGYSGTALLSEAGGAGIVIIRYAVAA